MNGPPTSFVAHIVNGQNVTDVVVHLSPTELEIWGLSQAAPWMKISGFITDGTVTENQLVGGGLVIINWRNVQQVTYDNPWVHIPRLQAIKIRR